MASVVYSDMVVHPNPEPKMPGFLETGVQSASEAQVLDRLQEILLILAALFLLLSGTVVLDKPNDGYTITNWLAYACGATSLISWSLVRRGYGSPRTASFNLLGIFTLVLGWSLSGLTATTVEVTTIVLASLLMTSALTFLDWRSFASLAFGAVTGWFTLAAHRSISVGLSLWSLTLFAALLVSCMVLYHRISRYRETQRELLVEANRRREEEARRRHFELAVEGTEDGLWYWCLESNSFQYSGAWAAMLGYGEGELETTIDTWWDRVHPAYLPATREAIANHLNGQSKQLVLTHQLRHRNGTYLWVLARATVVRGDSGQAVALAGSHCDVTPLIDAEKQLLKNAYHDKLTSLPNRDLLMRHLEKKLEERARGRTSKRCAVLFLDLDRFKVINDSLGHPVGDELLVKVAGRLRECVRSEDIVARFGGDEFVILLDSVRHSDEALAFGRRMVEALRSPFQIGGREVVSGASIGVAVSEPEGSNADDLLRYADIALYRAKADGKGRVQAFTEGMRSYATQLCDLQADLRQSISRQQLVLHYQPSFNIATGKIVGLEALLRWQRSESELIAPSQFIPLAEEIGLIPEIGEWALRRACQQSVAWQRSGILPVKIAVNVSTKQLQQPDFPDRVLHILAETGLAPELLELELTESALMDGADLAPKSLRRLSTSGLRIAIDDFGTGYSSLNYLRQFDFHTLKMDRCFVADVATSSKAASLAKGMINLAHSLDLPVIAEGIEDRQQLAFLSANLCDHGQGFLAGRPLCARETNEILRSGFVKHVLGLGSPGTDGLNRLANQVSSHAVDLSGSACSTDTERFERTTNT